MKVTQDAVIFGAWLCPPFSDVTALDIGTGTGLLSLILKNKYPHTRIHALEIEENAAKQAKENFLATDFAKDIQLVVRDVRNYQSEASYDYIFSNPPFFSQSTPSQNPKKQQAHHQEALNLSALTEAVLRLLKPDGSFAVLLPEVELAKLEKLFAQHNFYLQKKLRIINRRKRGLVCTNAAATFSAKACTAPEIQELIVHTPEMHYSEEMRALTGHLYL